MVTFGTGGRNGSERVDDLIGIGSQGRRNWHTRQNHHSEGHQEDKRRQEEAGYMPSFPFSPLEVEDPSDQLLQAAASATSERQDRG